MYATLTEMPLRSRMPFRLVLGLLGLGALVPTFFSCFCTFSCFLTAASFSPALHVHVCECAVPKPCRLASNLQSRQRGLGKIAAALTFQVVCVYVALCGLLVLLGHGLRTGYCYSRLVHPGVLPVYMSRGSCQ